MKRIVISSLAELKALPLGEDIASSDWQVITQERINQFADATGDHQWIHVDPVLAAKSPLGGTIAHGFLTLSLIPMLSAQCIEMPWVRMGLNYGLNRVRFTQPVPSGGKVRGRFALQTIEDIQGGVQIVMLATVDLQGSDKPACIAESVSRRYV